jgi:hypothetical protein
MKLAKTLDFLQASTYLQISTLGPQSGEANQTTSKDGQSPYFLSWGKAGCKLRRKNVALAT